MDIPSLLKDLKNQAPRAISRAISLIEEGHATAEEIIRGLGKEPLRNTTIVGVTGPPGAGKSSLVNRLISRYRSRALRIGVIAIDPSSPLGGGAVLGDRIRMMDHALDRDVVLRSMANRGKLGGLCRAAGGAAKIMAGAGCRIIIIETVGVGQSEIDIIDLADLSLCVLAPGMGDDIQAMKAGLLEMADLLVVNKADRPGAEALALYLENTVRNRRRPPPVCLTSATEDSGTEQLAEIIIETASRNRRSGEQLRRRAGNLNAEVLDSCLAIIQPQLIDLIEADRGSQADTPEGQARKILEQFLRNSSRGL